MKKVERQVGPDVDLAEELRATIGRFVRQIRSEASTPTSSQTETLGLLARMGPHTTASLAKIRGVKHQSMRLVVAELLSAGLITRVPNPNDGRAKNIELTNKGLDAVTSERTARTQAIAHLLEQRLSIEERICLAKALKIINKLTE
jgi:DNA-binding MarR family transcriptional regulator